MVRSQCAKMCEIINEQWEKLARKYGLSRNAIEYMRPAFDMRLFSMSSRRTPCGRTSLTESGLAFSVVRPLQTVEYMRPAFDMRLKE